MDAVSGRSVIGHVGSSIGSKRTVNTNRNRRVLIIELSQQKLQASRRRDQSYTGVIELVLRLIIPWGNWPS